MSYLVDQYGNPISDTNPLYVQLTGSNAKVDGTAAPIIPQMLYNGSTYDLQRDNTQGILLASAARTATTFSPNQTNYNARGIIVFLDVTVASGVGGLQIRLNFVDPVTGKTAALNSLPAAVTAIGSSAYILYPGATSSGATSGVLPRTWLLGVAHGDASSYTYSVGHALIL